MGYGTGAIMGAPGEDQRDFEFAPKYGLEIPRVTAPADGSPPPADRAFTEHGVTINSSGLTSPACRLPRRSRCLQVRRGTRDRPRHRQLPDARLAHLAPALLGMSDSDRLLPARRHRAGPRGSASGAAARDEGLPALGHRPLSAGQRAGIRQHHLSQMRRTRRARDRHHGRLRLLVVVLPALRVAAHDRAVRSRGRPTTGCRWIFTSAAPSMPSCICCTRGCGPR